MNRFLFSFFIVGLLVMALTSAQVSIGETKIKGVSIQYPTQPTGSNFNNATGSVNNSVCWQGNCNESSVVHDSGDTMFGVLNFDGVAKTTSLTPQINCRANAIGVPICYSVNDASGGIIGAIGRVSGAFGIFAQNNVDTIISNDALTSFWALRDDGSMENFATDWLLNIGSTNVLIHDGTQFFSLGNWDYGLGLLNNIAAASATDGLRGVYSPYTYDLEFNTGWYRPSENNQSLQVGGIDQLSVNNFTTTTYGNLTVNDPQDMVITNWIENKTGVALNVVSHDHNGTGTKFASGTYNETSGELIPHPDIDITSTTAFNVAYNNTADRPISITFHVNCRTSAGLNDGAFATLRNNFTGSNYNGFPEKGRLCLESVVSVAVIDDDMGTMVVQPGKIWTINSTLVGTGSLSLSRVIKTYL